MSAPDFAALPSMNDQKKQKFHVIQGVEARPAAQRFAQRSESGENAVDSYLNARYDGTNGRPHLSVISDLDSSGNASNYTGFGRALTRTGKEPGKQNKTGLKKNKKTGSGLQEMPPTPFGCEWKKADDGWNLWRYWSEKDAQSGLRIKKSRYAGTLSNEAWHVMKDYDYETFISVIGQRLRRYGKR
ncbi:MAG: hypothetical protein IPO77_07865 [Acidobacteria bacterium]|nr:hypothetical protein [Acidobacteriota bacterium]